MKVFKKLVLLLVHGPLVFFVFLARDFLDIFAGAKILAGNSPAGPHRLNPPSNKLLKN